MSSHGLQATTNPNRPYQGYPYVNPIVTDAPTLNPDEVAARAKWSNLPTKKIVSSVKQIDENPVIYIDIPDEETGETRDGPPRKTQSRPAPPVPSPAPASLSPASRPSGSMHKEDAPVVYIDIEESSGSEVSQSRVEEQAEPEYVQETILYDPFKERRISVKENDSHTSSVNPESSNTRQPPRRPLPPSNLNVPSAGGSSGYGGSSSYTPSPSQSNPYLSKETYVYGRQPTPDDGFPLSPIPVSEFPLPPPSYEEIDSRPQNRPVTEQPRQPAPPPTQVITSPNYPGVVGMPHHDRKYLQCQHCNTNVHTLVIKENGLFTHLFAWSFMLCCLCPITAIIYCMKYWKYKNHYCPNCNKKIGYQGPCCCTELAYVGE